MACHGRRSPSDHAAGSDSRLFQRPSVLPTHSAVQEQEAFETRRTPGNQKTEDRTGEAGRKDVDLMSLTESEARTQAIANTLALTPAERQEVLRRLKYGPYLGRESLARYALRVRDEVLKKRRTSK